MLELALGVVAAREAVLKRQSAGRDEREVDIDIGEEFERLVARD